MLAPGPFWDDLLPARLFRAPSRCLAHLSLQVRVLVAQKEPLGLPAARPVRSFNGSAALHFTHIVAKERPHDRRWPR